jgi:hypothetical protein
MPIEKAKEFIIQLISQGHSVEDSCKAAGKSVKSYEYYRASDADFKQAIELARAIQKREGALLGEDANISFEDFRTKYLMSQTFEHQLNMIDLLEDRDPRWVHEAMTYEPGERQYVLINIPPDHAKSMTVSIDYVTYRVCLDPNIRVKIVSKTQTMAAEFLYAIKQRMTNPTWIELQKKFAPAEGWKATADKWTNTEIYLARDSNEKDPTIQALGIGGHIYGARCDLIILDDCVTLSNAGEYEKQMRWIQQDCVTRLGPFSKLFIVGTRVDPIDLYKELRNSARYPEGESPWTYLAMPAILEIDDDPAKWVTLWPKSDRPWLKDTTGPDEKGFYPRWDGPHLKKRRAILEPRTWAMVYQQQDVSSEAIFNKEAVQGSVNGMRASGPIIADAPGHPKMDHKPYIICSMDPAMSGDTFSIVYAGDNKTQKRYVLECSKMTAPTPAKIRELIFSWTERYQPKVWVIEKNAFQLFLTQDEQINAFLATRGIRLVQHYTGANKMDAEFGVASVSTLFGHVDNNGKHLGDNLIELPRTDSESVKALIEQLVTWSPGTKNKSDGPMALWFAETQMRGYLTQTGVYQESMVKNPYATRGDLAKRKVVNLDEYTKIQEQLAANGGTFFGAINRGS